ncbi:MAG: hypothetical protein ACUVRV_02210 [Cyanobacteriota bacterium]
MILLSGFFASRNNLSVAAATAISATLVGIIHGILFWLLRRRQRSVRQEAIDQIREMLEDLVKNRIQTIKMSLYIAQAHRPEEEERIQQSFERVYQILREMNHLVDHISEESLTSWRHRYQQTLRYIESADELTNNRS